MKELRRNIAIVLCLMFVALSGTAVFLLSSVHRSGGEWVNSASNARLRQRGVPAGRILDRKGTVLAYTRDGRRIYTDAARSCSHIVGDELGYCATGAETLYAALLKNLQETERERITRLVNRRQMTGRDVVLTVDSRLQAAADTAMGDYRGAVILMNYKTGEVLCMVSHPQYDAADVAALAQEADDSAAPLLNRAISGRYPPGSTFKIVTAVAALETGFDPDMTVECTGSFAVGGGAITCGGGKGHGKVDMATAFAKSCNTYFAQTGLSLGSSRLQDAADDLGFNRSLQWEGSLVPGGVVNLKGASAPDIARAAIGQHTVTATPLLMAELVSAVANGGVAQEPRLLAGSGVEGSMTRPAQPSSARRLMPEETAAQMLAMMLACVQDGTGTKAAVRGVPMAGKTGSAQVSGDGSQASHGWFVGFVADDNHPLAVVVLLENSGSGGATAAPVASRLVTKALSLGY